MNDEQPTRGDRVVLYGAIAFGLAIWALAAYGFVRLVGG